MAAGGNKDLTCHSKVIQFWSSHPTTHMVFLKLVASVAGTLGAYALYTVVRVFYLERTSPLQSVPGPKSSHWLLGNLKEVMPNEVRALDYLPQEKWTSQYGRTIRFNSFVGFGQLYTIDPKALNHVLSNAYTYQKSEISRYILGKIIGPGILLVEEDVHRKQRKIMNPAFGPAQVRDLTSVFVEKSSQLRDVWMAETVSGGGAVKVNIIPWLDKATLDIIGLAGFNYKFNALGASGAVRDELDEALATALASVGLGTILKGLIPVLRVVPTPVDKVIRHSQAVMARISRVLLENSKKELAESGAFGNGGGRDLLTLLVRANTSKDVPEHQRLTDADVLAQVSNFLVAGHETISSGAVWALFALSKNIAVQMMLRAELLAVGTDNPTMDELNALQYLDCVVRETLRLHAPVTQSARVAMCDDVIPLSTPYVDVHGNVRESFRIMKGQPVVIPILALNRDTTIWGPDALEFKPERWDSKNPISTSIPGVWGEMLTFIGGPRACIGYRFALVELKALLFTLVRGLEFELAVPAADIGAQSTVLVQRPIVLSDVATGNQGGNQLPLLIKPFIRS
ncbi:cytochrome P450 [Mycena alexandri]|uniref:Cytochrome P450 n=1 Tax=Mycena alexandri TaxID=1745969 RepID=A0AAD6SA31_9AGAR|nr:cytochrome P450 [Mycena alexandri]